MSQKRLILEMMVAKTRARTSMKMLTSATPKSEVIQQVPEIEMETNASEMTGHMTGAATGVMTGAHAEMIETLSGTGLGVAMVIDEGEMTGGGMMTGAVTDRVVTQAETAMTGEEIVMGTEEMTAGVREMVGTEGGTGMTGTRTGGMPDVKITRKIKKMTSKYTYVCVAMASNRPPKNQFSPYFQCTFHGFVLVISVACRLLFLLLFTFA